MEQDLKSGLLGRHGRTEFSSTAINRLRYTYSIIYSYDLPASTSKVVLYLYGHDMCMYVPHYNSLNNSAIHGALPPNNTAAAVLAAGPTLTQLNMHEIDFFWARLPVISKR